MDVTHSERCEQVYHALLFEAPFEAFGVIFMLVHAQYTTRYRVPLFERSLTSCNAYVFVGETRKRKERSEMPDAIKRKASRYVVGLILLLVVLFVSLPSLFTPFP